MTTVHTRRLGASAWLAARGRTRIGRTRVLRIASALIAVVAAAGLTVVPAAGVPAALAAAANGSQDGQGSQGARVPLANHGNLAGLVDTRTWTTGGGNTFPGADAPFGMVQWSPDTLPNPGDGGGYSATDTTLGGYSLTHVSGAGCPVAGDIGVLPLAGALPAGDPSAVTTPFSHTGEVAQAGYYSAQSNGPDAPVTTQLTATPHSGLGRFGFGASGQGGLLVKLTSSQAGTFGDSAQVTGSSEVSGSVTSGEICGRTGPGSQQYTVYFDLTFSQPFTSSQVITQAGSSDPDAVFLSFDTSADPVVSVKAGVSYVSAADARLNWQREDPGWDFAAVKAAAQRSWNTHLAAIAVSGGSQAQTQEFYSLLYKSLLEPSIASDVNGRYLGADGQVHTLARGQRNQYGVFSGWDIYHSLTQLQAMLDPAAASDQAQSLVNYYAQSGQLQRWGYMNTDALIMVGDPADSIIADDYAFGARGFDTRQALADMLTQANTVNNVRPGEAIEQQLGYLPYDASYQCPVCNTTERDWVASLLEDDNADAALSQFASSLGDRKDAAALKRRSNNWENIFDPATGLLTPRSAAGQFMPGVTPASTGPYVEGSAEEYLWDVPDDYRALFTLLGGDQAAAAQLSDFLAQPNGGGAQALLSNEFGLGEQNAPDYARDPAGAQLAVNTLRTTLLAPGASGLPNNDDTGAESSAFIWSMLGMYPENPGTGTLVLASPGFPREAIRLPSGHTVSISAPGASPARFYVRSLRLSGQSYRKLYLPYSQLARGATLDWTLSATPTSWGSAAADTPPSDTAGLRPAVGFVSASQALVAPGAATTLTAAAQDAAGRAQTVTATVSAPAGLTVTPGSAQISVPADGRGSVPVSISAAAGMAEGQYPVTVTFTEAGAVIGTASVSVAVDTPGDLGPFVTSTGVTDDSAPAAGNLDGTGDTYSAQALAAAGITPGGPVTAGGVTFTWPDAAPGTPDNVIAAGQTVLVSGSGSQLGFLGTAVNGAFTATGTVFYTDGTSAPYTVSFVNWTSGSPPAPGVVAAKLPYLNTPAGQLTRNRFLYAAFAPIDPTRTVQAVQLPSAGSGDTGIHIFAVAAG